MQVNEKVYQTIMETAQEGIWIINHCYITTYVNNKIAEMLGYTKDDLIGQCFTDFLSKETANMAIKSIEMKYPSPQQAVAKFYCNHGIERWVILTYTHFYNDEDQYTGSLAMVNDITDRKKTEQLLTDSQHKYRQLFSLIADPVFLIDNEFGQIIEVNKAASSVYGYSREELINMKNIDLSAEPSQTKMATDKGLGSVPMRWHRRKNGMIFPVEIVAKHLVWQGRNVHIAAIRDISERHQAEKALLESEQRYRDIFEHSSDCMFLMNVTEGIRFQYVKFNPAEEKAVGLKSEEVSGKLVEEVFNEDLAYKLNQNYQRCYDNGEMISYEQELELPTGVYCFHTVLIPIKNARGQITRIVGIGRDITEQKKMEKIIKHRISLENAISQASRLFVTPNDADINRVLEILGRSVSVNRAYTFRFRENGKKMDNVFEWCKPGTESQFHNLQDVNSDILPWRMNQLKLGANVEISNVSNLPPEALAEKEILQAQGIKSLIVVPIQSTDGKLTGFMGFDDTQDYREWSKEDVKALRVVAEMVGVYWERKRIEEALQYHATHDFLTSIPNRYYLEEKLKGAIVNAAKGEKCSLLFIDLDNFKLVNDTLGHKAGDELLKALIRIFKENLDDRACLSRLGGDEFAILLEGFSFQEAGKIAEKIRQAVWNSELNLITHGFRLNPSISIGVIAVDGTLDYQRCLALADSALYIAKEQGRNRVSFYAPKNDTVGRLTETNYILGLIKTGLNENRFVLHFQPVFRMSDRKIIHYEALIRLYDSTGQMITPGRFIPVAESFGLMSQIDLWVVKSSLKAMRENPELTLFINLSGLTLGDEAALKQIELSIKKSGIEPSRLGFEITETAAVKDLIRAERWIRKLKGIGCLFALDDFGIGFSSFTYLRALPVDYIKIDGSFVQNADKEPVHRALIQAIYNIANTLGMRTIAEFIENEDILNLLRSIGVDYGQGFFLGKPDVCLKPDIE